jgi:uncharacterized membrane protein
MHILSSWLPLYAIIFSGLMLSMSLLLKHSKLFNIAMLLIVFSGLMSFITGALGGASMRGVKAEQGINYAALQLHAWSSFGAIAFALVLGILAFQRFRRKTESDKITSIMMVIIGLLLFAFLITSMNFASQIRIEPLH